MTWWFPAAVSAFPSEGRRAAMKRLERFLPMLGITVFALTQALPIVAAPPRRTLPTITIHVSNYAGVEPKDLAEAERVAAAVFTNAGVSVRWMDVEVASNTEYSRRESENPPSISQIQVHIQSSSLAGLPGLSEEAMGLAPGSGPDRHLVYVFYDRVKELAQRQVATQVRGVTVARAAGCRILGEMIAHEIGHILLNLPGHSETGIMRGYWGLKDLQDVAFGELLFTKQQSKVIETEVIRRSSIDVR
jgi:hypothetical protein